MSGGSHSQKKVTVDTFRKDPLYPRIARAMEQILARGKVVAPVDVLVRMDLLAPEHLEDWRRELVTGAVFRAIDPSGYRGRRGELWHVRVLPPPIPGTAEHVVFTTPYLLLEPGELDWQAYFRRTLPDRTASWKTRRSKR